MNPCQSLENAIVNRGAFRFNILNTELIYWFEFLFKFIHKQTYSLYICVNYVSLKTQEYL
jgi:hypothetical protein